MRIDDIDDEDFLFERYQDCYEVAKFNCDAAAMLIASDRMAALLGISFCYGECDCEDEEDEV